MVRMVRAREIPSHFGQRQNLAKLIGRVEAYRQWLDNAVPVVLGMCVATSHNVAGPAVDLDC